jgi:hypothetical protein
MQSSPPPVPVPPKIEFDEQMRPRIKIPSLISPLTMQRAAEQSASGGMSVPASIESAIQSARGGGQALPENTRAAMEGAIGADFGGVRVHTGGQSDTLNEALSARAFTTGQDIFFRQGEYAPQSGEGQKLLAHELTHVVQQEAISNSIANSTIQRSITDYTSFNKEIFQSLDSETGKRIYLYTNIGPGTNFDNQIRELYLNAYNTYMSYSQPDTDELKLALNNLHEALKIHEHKISLWDKISWSKMSQNSNEEIYAALQQFEDLSKSYKDLEEKLEPLYSYKNKNNNNISDEAEKVFKDMKKQFNQWNGQRGTRGAWYGSNQPGNTTGAQRVSPSVVTELKQLTQNTTWQFQTSFSGGLSFHRTRGNIDFIYHMDLS